MIDASIPMRVEPFRLADILQQARENHRADQSQGMRLQEFTQHQADRTEDREIRLTQAEQAKRQRDIQAMGLFAKHANDGETWDAGVDQLVRMGYPDAAQYRGQFSPATRAAIMGAAGVEDKEHDPTSLEREYRFLETIETGLGGKFARNKAEGQPLIASNGDGTFTIVPRNMVQPGAAGAGAPSGRRQIRSTEEYNALPPGTPYIDPNGQPRTKGGGSPSNGSAGF